MVFPNSLDRLFDQTSKVRTEGMGVGAGLDEMEIFVEDDVVWKSYVFFWGGIYNLEKLRWNLKNYLFEKRHYLPNIHFLNFILIFRGVFVYLCLFFFTRFEWEVAKSDDFK